MRILFMTNFYPPHEMGGQGRSCLQVVEGLQERGHETFVLTSMKGTGNRPETAGGVARLLYLEMDFAAWRNSVRFFFGRKQREETNVQRLKQVVRDFEPDVLYIWGMWNIPRTTPLAAEALLPGRVIYRFAEYWPTLPSQHRMYWESTAQNNLSRFVKGLLRPLALTMLDRQPPLPPLKFEQAICVSQATCEKLVSMGIPIEDAHIVHTGLDPAPYLAGAPVLDDVPPLRLLYAGRITAEKGIETTLEAMALLRQAGDVMPMQLTVAGQGADRYVAGLRRQAVAAGLSDQVQFIGRVAPDKMPALYWQHQVLVVPSVWPEPLARVILEGMAAGLVVVASTAGGTREAVEDGQNGLLFQPHDTAGQARQLRRAAEEPSLRTRLAKNGRQTVCQHFTVEKMFTSLETILEQVADG